MWELKTQRRRERGSTHSPFSPPSLPPSLPLLPLYQMIHLFVEILDRYFGNVCELDIIFNFHKVGREGGRDRMEGGEGVG